MTRAQLEPSIAAVVVTYNRFALLQEAIAALRAQTRKLDEIIVIDNGSTDESAAWLAQQNDLTVIRQENLGSSGGQYTGIKTAYEKNHDWIWCMDDDTIPQPDALAKLVEKPQFKEESTGFLCSAIRWTDGTPHRMNTPYPIDPETWFHTVLEDRCMVTRTASFVSVLFSRAAVARVGLPLKGLFLWFDDAEYTARISRYFRNWVVLDSIALHKTKLNAGAQMDRVRPEDRMRFLYGARNHIIFLRADDTSFARRWLTIASISMRNLAKVLRGRAPVASIGWMIRGLFYPIRIDRV